MFARTVYALVSRFFYGIQDMYRYTCEHKWPDLLGDKMRFDFGFVFCEPDFDITFH